jgi:hypothetical protein
VLGEPLTAGIVAAFVLILAGSVLATRPSRPSPLPAGPARAGESAAGGRSPLDESAGGAARR